MSTEDVLLKAIINIKLTILKPLIKVRNNKKLIVCRTNPRSSAFIPKLIFCLLL